MHARQPTERECACGLHLGEVHGHERHEEADDVCEQVRRVCEDRERAAEPPAGHLDGHEHKAQQDGQLQLALFVPGHRSDDDCLKNTKDMQSEQSQHPKILLTCARSAETNLPFP